MSLQVANLLVQFRVKGEGEKKVLNFYMLS